MNNGSVFSVTPMGSLLELNPGETYSGCIKVINPANATNDFDYKVYVAPYSVVSEKYNVDVVTTTDRTMIVDWITIREPKGTLSPNEAATIDYDIKVPETAPSGGQYAAIIVGVDNVGSKYDNVAITNATEIASVLYARVAGETVHAGQVLENNVPGFSFVAPFTVSALIDNSGNVHEEAEIGIEVSNVLTGEKILPSTIDDGINIELIMPETKKYVNRVIGDLPTIGVVKVKQSIYYNYQMSVVEKDVIICPVWLLILIIVILCACIAKIYKTIRKRKNKNNHK